VPAFIANCRRSTSRRSSRAVPSPARSPSKSIFTALTTVRGPGVTVTVACSRAALSKSISTVAEK
jgi:uncharacterized protein YlxW (UPF0749 family)